VPDDGAGRGEELLGALTACRCRGVPHAPSKETPWSADPAARRLSRTSV
jgi:hypothetical protein